MERRELILEGKDLEDIIEDGLSKISKAREDVDIEVTEVEKSFFGKVKKYEVKISYEEEIGNEKIEVSKEIVPSFYIDYLEDGVYLTLFQEGDKVDLMTIFDILGKYSVKDMMFSEIKKGFTEYGGIPFKVAPQQEVEVPEDGFFSYTSEDKMKAYLILFSNNEKTASEILELLSSEYKVGIDIAEIERAIEEKIHNKPILIAEGRPPVDGEDGYIDYKFNIAAANSPKQNIDGSVDFKELELFNNVEADTVIAEKILPKKGEDGQNVNGETVPFKIGKDASFRYGKNVEEIDDGRAIVSKVDGQVKLEDGKINIYEVYEVKGNVDNSVGNIDFKGSVKVKGNVLTGFSIKCKGDLEIDGVVEASKIDCDGNILIKKGILGSDNCEIKAKGKIFSRYIESACVYSDTLVEAEMVLHSDIVSRGDVLGSGQKGAIMGGRIRAKNEVRAKTIGAVMATPTVIEVGVDPYLKGESEVLRKGIDSVEGDIYKLEQVLGHLKNGYEKGALDDKKKEMYLSAVNTKSELERELSEMEAKMDRYNYEKSAIKGRVVFDNAVHPGVKIVIGTSIYQVDEDIVRSTIYKDHFDGEIKVGPFVEK